MQTRRIDATAWRSKKVYERAHDCATNYLIIACVRYLRLVFRIGYFSVLILDDEMPFLL